MWVSPSLWYDEVYTLKLAGLPLEKMFQALAGDVHPPLFYVIQWVIIRLFGPAALRVSSLLFGLAALWQAWRILAALPLSDQLRQISLALMAVSPFMVFYATEGRMYSLLLFFILLGARAALMGNWAGLGITLGLGLLSHNHMALYAPGLILIFITMKEVSFPLKEASKTLLLAGLIYAPWAATAWQQLHAISAGDYWILPLTPGGMVYMVIQLLLGYSMTGLALLIVAGCGQILLLIGTILAIRARSYEIIILAYGPIFCGIILSVLVGPILIARPLIGVVPFLLILIAWGGYHLWPLAGHWLTAAGIAACLIAAQSIFISPARPDYATSYAALGVRPGATCYHLSAGSHILASYYLPQCYHITWPAAPRKPNGLSPETITAMAIERGRWSPRWRGPVWGFSTLEPYTPQAETVYLAQIVGPDSQKFILLENEFVTAAAWRLDE